MNLLVNLLPVGLQRKFYLSRARCDLLKDYYSQPVPSPETKLIDLEFIVVDFETTGLNPAEDSILSIGYCIIKNNHIVLNKSVYQVVRQERLMSSQNVAIHGITDSDARKGIEFKMAMSELVQAMKGRVLIAHNAAIETAFINSACETLFKSPLLVRVIDTMKLEMRKLQQQGRVIKTNDLRLFNIRKRYGLPRYKAHNALEDAVSTAEVFLAITAKYSAKKNNRLKEFI